MGSFVIMFTPGVMVFKMAKMAHFLHFLLVTSKNQSEVRQNISAHLKNLN